MSKLAARLVAVDDLLLDRVFQPVTDRLGDRPSAFDVGMSLQLGAVVLELTSDVALYAAGALGITDGLYDGLSCGAGLLFYGYMARQRPLVRGGTPNPLRPMYRPMRLLGLGFAAYSLFSSIESDAASALSYGLGALSNLAFVAGIYFISCQPRPPGWRPVSKPVSAKTASGLA